MDRRVKPWDGVVPAEDLDAFVGGAGRANRALSAGSVPALVVVDMTRAFVDSRYPTGFSRTGAPAVAHNVVLLAAARAARVPVFFTKAYATEDHNPTAAERLGWKQTREGRVFEFAPGLPPGDVIVDELAPLPGETVVCKGGRPSAFFGTALASYLIHAGCDTVIVSGMTTSGCVRATVLDAFQFNFACVVPYECTADRSQVSHAVSLFDLHMKYADVVSLDETLAYLATTRSHRPDV